MLCGACSQYTHTHQAAQCHLPIEFHLYIPQYKDGIASQKEIGDYRDDYEEVSNSEILSEHKHGSGRHTRLGNDNPLLLSSAKTQARDVTVPGHVHWSALGYQENGEDNIRDRQENDCALKRSDESFCDWDT